MTTTRMALIIGAIVVAGLGLWLVYFYTNPALDHADVICMDGPSAGAPSDLPQCVSRP